MWRYTEVDGVYLGPLSVVILIMEADMGASASYILVDEYLYFYYPWKRIELAPLDNRCKW